MTLSRVKAATAEPGTPRLRIKPTTLGTGEVDGAWRPPTDDLTVALLAPRLRPITQVIYHPHAWRQGVPKELPSKTGPVSLEGSRSQPTDTIYLFGADRTRLVLLVVPASANARDAESILSAPAGGGAGSTTGQLLSANDLHDPISAVTAPESEGGHTAGKSYQTPSSPKFDSASSTKDMS